MHTWSRRFEVVFAGKDLSDLYCEITGFLERRLTIRVGNKDGWLWFMVIGSHYMDCSLFLIWLLSMGIPLMCGVNILVLKKYKDVEAVFMPRRTGRLSPAKIVLLSMFIWYPPNVM